jgi:ligand-binding sensor domain-containing protein
LDRFDPTTESFTHYRLDPAVNTPVTVVQITQDQAGTLWLATDNGLYGLDSGTARVTHHYLHDPQNPLSLSSNNVRYAAEDRKGRIWVTDGSDTLEQFDRRTGNVNVRFTLASSVREFSFHEDATGILWTYSSEGPFASLDPDSGELTYYSFYDERSKTPLAVNVTSMLQDKDGALWFGTMREGLLKFDSDHRMAICYRHQPASAQSLAEDNVIALTQDDEGNIWVGMHASAPNFFSNRRPAFRPLLGDNVSPNSLGERLINFIYEDRKGTLWVATPGALLGINSKNGKYRSYHPPGGLTGDIVAITEDRAGTLWVGTIGHGLNRFNPDTGRFTAYRHNPADPSSLSNDAVDRLYVDRKGTIWVATWDGLNRFDPASGRFVVFRNTSPSQAYPVYGIAEDQGGALWLGGNSGLQYFDPDTGKFTVYQHRLDDPSSISDNRVFSIYVDQSGTVWIATEDGLDKLESPKRNLHSLLRQGWIAQQSSEWYPGRRSRPHVDQHYKRFVGVRSRGENLHQLFSR